MDPDKVLNGLNLHGSAFRSHGGRASFLKGKQCRKL